MGRSCNFADVKEDASGEYGVKYALRTGMDRFSISTTIWIGDDKWAKSDEGVWRTLTPQIRG